MSTDPFKEDPVDGLFMKIHDHYGEDFAIAMFKIVIPEWARKTKEEWHKKKEKAEKWDNFIVYMRKMMNILTLTIQEKMEFQEAQRRLGSIAVELKRFIVDGWSSRELLQWDEYLEEELKPIYPELYALLKGRIGRKEPGG